MRKVNRDEEEAATINGCKFFENMRCNAHDDMMNATNKIKHKANTKYMEGVWSIGLGALQHSTTTRGSRPEI